MSSSKRRTVTLESDGEERPVSIRLKKWSVAKCLHLLRDVGEVGKMLGDFSISGDIKPADIAHVIMTLGEEAGMRVTRLIKESVEDPKELTENDILEWMLEDYVLVLTVLIEMNLTQSLAKNFGSLKTAISSRIPQTATAKVAEVDERIVEVGEAVKMAKAQAKAAAR
jgi:hypothetical protein